MGLLDKIKLIMPKRTKAPKVAMSFTRKLQFMNKVMTLQKTAYKQAARG